MIRKRVPYFIPKRTTGQGYSDYYNAQLGNGINVYSGRSFQSGHGFGGALLGLMRSATPLWKTVGKSLFRAGVGVAKDMMEGETFKKSMKRQGVGALKSLASTTLSAGKKTTAPNKARAGTKRRQRSPQTNAGSCKRRRGDIFDR